MMIRFPAGAPVARIESAGPPARLTANDRRTVMKWETPQAIDLRFGMEITMYIAHR